MKLAIAFAATMLVLPAYAVTENADVVNVDFGGGITAVCGKATEFEADKASAFTYVEGSGGKTLEYGHQDEQAIMAELNRIQGSQITGEHLYVFTGDYAVFGLENEGRFCVVQPPMKLTEFETIVTTAVNGEGA